jgi:hypothetical protein
MIPGPIRVSCVMVHRVAGLFRSGEPVLGFFTQQRCARRGGAATRLWGETLHDPLLAGVWFTVTSEAGRLIVLAPALVAVVLAGAFHRAAAGSTPRTRPGRSAP